MRGAFGWQRTIRQIPKEVSADYHGHPSPVFFTVASRETEERGKSGKVSASSRAKSGCQGSILYCSKLLFPRRLTVFIFRRLKNEARLVTSPELSTRLFVLWSISADFTPDCSEGLKEYIAEARQPPKCIE
ncbi:hypothetical protein KQX54_019294 [Cotesia glomerata]|uniref:Uncharacterized protein n=1 Tax=Cotesia glomerata TaxID=32391 RepID=A0AAV7HLJ2_COTGL|nr:hypothetical protein KQX54_019294 [Cotesia glomerata]